MNSAAFGVPVRAVDARLGFAFSGAGFSWAKQNCSGVGWLMGSGYGTRLNVEICWQGPRGSPRRKLAGVREMIIAPAREYSRKPVEVYHGSWRSAMDLISSCSRDTWPGWTCVGDEIGKFQPEEAHDRSQ